MPDFPYSLRLRPATYEALDEASQKLTMSKSQIVHQALTMWFEKNGIPLGDDLLRQRNAKPLATGARDQITSADLDQRLAELMKGLEERIKDLEEKAND